MSSKKEFVIVEFLGRNEVEVVPKSWLLSQRHPSGEVKWFCRWPKSGSNYSQLVNNYTAPALNWAKHQCRTIGKTYSDVKEARRHCKTAEMTSDLSSAENRPRKKIRTESPPSKIQPPAFLANIVHDLNAEKSKGRGNSSSSHSNGRKGISPHSCHSHTEKSSSHSKAPQGHSNSSGLSNKNKSSMTQSQNVTKKTSREKSSSKEKSNHRSPSKNKDKRTKSSENSSSVNGRRKHQSPTLKSDRGSSKKPTGKDRPDSSRSTSATTQKTTTNFESPFGFSCSPCFSDDDLVSLHSPVRISQTRPGNYL